MIRSGEYLEGFDALPNGIRWDIERIERSLAETLQARPGSSDVWVFGYGSLLWNPLMHVAEQQSATLHGWQRSFCIRMTASRGSPQWPGRMLALEPGGLTQGVALRIAEANIDEELLLLWIREMPTGAYRPSWIPITLADGREVTAIVFVADPACALYEFDTSLACVTPLMSTACGPFGSNAEYVFKLEAALAECGESDPYIDVLANALRGAVV